MILKLFHTATGKETQQPNCFITISTNPFSITLRLIESRIAQSVPFLVSSLIAMMNNKPTTAPLLSLGHERNRTPANA